MSMRTGLTLLAAKRDEGREQGVWRRRFGSILTELAIWLPLSIAAGHVVLFTAWTTWVSFTASSLMPDYTWVGLRNYWAMTRTANFQIAYVNLLIFGFGFVLLTMALGLLLAILLDQRVRGENVLRTIFLYPLAVSFVVTGTVWSWLLNPGLGLQRVVQNLGWQDFRFDWLVQSDKAIYTLIFAGVWQGAGFAMALFLAGLRSVDADLVKAAQIDGAGPWRTYRRVLLPTIWPIFITVFVILLRSAITSFDLVRALTGGGPGISTMLPTLVVYDFMFQRSELGRGSAAAALIILALLFLVPLGVVVVNSLRSSREIAATSLIGWPSHLIFTNYGQAWNRFCMAEHCWGIEPYMLNSLTLAIPATIISTLLGALAGYSISLWRFRGDQFVFGLVTLGIFLPEQMKLIPWVVVLRDLSLMNTIAGLILIHTVQGMSFTTLFCRNYYVGIPQDLLKAARIDGAGFFRIFWRIILPLSPPILIVTVIFQFTGIWNEFLYGVTFTSGGQQPVTAALIALSAAITSEPMYGEQSAAVLIAALPTLP